MAFPSLLMLHLAILALFISSKFPFLAAQVHPLSISTDKQALLSFKSQIDVELSPNILSTWDQNLSPCNWTGVFCNKNGARVVGLDLANMGLKGSLSPYIGNLSFLRTLELQNNQFSGPFPSQIGNLFRLRLLNMSSNNIQGVLPQNISMLVELRTLDLMLNQFFGRIPGDIAQLKNLQVLNLGRNRFSGPIPPSIANISSLTILNLGTNTLSGIIPGELDRLKILKQLDLGINNLTGIVPPTIYNISSLVYLSLASNDLWGTLPYDIGITLPNLLVTLFCYNKFTGTIPGSLHNLTNIQIIRMSHNLLHGTIPPGLGNLPELKMYNIGFNRIISSGDNGLNFLSSLANSTHLDVLAIDSNLLEGVIPDSICNLSKVLTKLYMGGNRIYGSIPSSIFHLRGLSMLNLSYNLISGEIPQEIGQLQSLLELNLAGNNISGKIPPSVGDLRKLIKIDLSRNELGGTIPISLGNLQNLLSIDLSNNKLKGLIPKEILMLPGLNIYLNLSNNFLNGTLLPEVGMLKSVLSIELSHNGLSGTIPNSIGNCKSLQKLSMAYNSFYGQIPDNLEILNALETLDISSNKLSGSIPHSLQKLQALQWLNLSFNDLAGQVPLDGIFANLSEVSLEGNPNLCFHLACEKTGDHRKNVILLSTLVPVSAILALWFSISLHLYLRKNKAYAVSLFESFERQHQLVSYDELRLATENFNRENLIGSGSFGSVYKGFLGEGNAIAVKVLDIDMTGSRKSFLGECAASKNVKHRNLVKLITTCSSPEFLALVYEFMSNGSLEYWITGRRRHESGEGLNIVERVNVAIDVACVMDYLHHECGAEVVHCDIKPTNILLDEDMTAKLGDFGLAKLLINRNSSDQTSLSSIHGLKGSIGYIPPEYGLGEKPSPAGDVYSYGITLLELFTGKRPTDGSFSGGMTLRAWVEMAFPTTIEQVLDPYLLPNTEICYGNDRCITPQAQCHCLVSLLDVALSCTVDSPDGRTSMKEVLCKLKFIRNTLFKPHQ